MKNLYGFTLNRLEDLMLEMGQKKYRATQLFKWIYERNVTSFDEMSDISLSFRETLKQEFCLEIPSIYKKQISNDGTIKLLLELSDGAKIETVLMRYNYGCVACVTSQVGCNMGCAFCASGLLKKQRNLEAYEMIGQVIVLNNLLKEEKQKIVNIVVMGTGEPFDNYDNVMEFLRIANHPYGLAIGVRHLTVSTCGLVDKIYDYANEGTHMNLAISLHAPNDKIRNKIMPISLKYPLNDVMEALRYYADKTKRRVTVEYILLENINDSLENAHELAALLKGLNNYVNLIPYNPVEKFKYKRASNNKIHRFMDELIKEGVNARIRKEFGTDIDAACGQLRAKND